MRTFPRGILITGGAGFVGSNLATALKRDLTDTPVVAFDNLKRRGSELALERLREGGVEFRHGDVRHASDLEEAGTFDLLIECSAEPSVHAGYGGGPSYVVDTNLTGAVNCLEAARRNGAALVFLSTSRVYPIAGLRGLPFERSGDRLIIPPGAGGPGWSEAGITTDFPLSGGRSLYGATKLAAELLIEEYRDMYGLECVVNRCGILAGPWQMGKVDQGVVVLWAARHLHGGRLSYSGFGGEGIQVRDALHVDDLYDLLRIQIADPARHGARVHNVGGGPGNAFSLAELTQACAGRAGRSIPMGSDPETRPADIPWYVADNAEVSALTGWTPKRRLDDVLDDIFEWLRVFGDRLKAVLG